MVLITLFTEEGKCDFIGIRHIVSCGLPMRSAIFWLLERSSQLHNKPKNLPHDAP